MIGLEKSTFGNYYSNHEFSQETSIYTKNQWVEFLWGTGILT